MRLDDLLPILGVPQGKLEMPAVLQVASRIIELPATSYRGLHMKDGVLVSYALYGALYNPTSSQATGQAVLDNLHQFYTPLQVSYVRDRTLSIILDEQDKLRIPPDGVSRADKATQARFHLITRANKGHLLREAEHIYQAFLHAPLMAVSTDPQRAKRVEEIYQTFSRMPLNPI